MTACGLAHHTPLLSPPSPYYSPPHTYTPAGPNTTEGILEGIYDLFTNRFVKQLKSKEVYDAFLEKAAAAGKAAVVLATTKTQTTSLYEGLSMQLRKGLAFGEQRCSVLHRGGQFIATDLQRLLRPMAWG